MKNYLVKFQLKINGPELIDSVWSDTGKLGAIRFLNEKYKQTVLIVEIKEMKFEDELVLDFIEAKKNLELVESGKKKPEPVIKFGSTELKNNCTGREERYTF